MWGEKLECAISLGMICVTESAWTWLEGMDQVVKGPVLQEENPNSCISVNWIKLCI